VKIWLAGRGSEGEVNEGFFSLLLNIFPLRLWAEITSPLESSSSLAPSDAVTNDHTPASSGIKFFKIDFQATRS
jgi:hypothetical protein